MNLALFSPAQSKVYSLIFGFSERAFYLNELITLTGLGSASLQREIKRLAQAGLLTEKRVGNLRQLQANPASPIFAEITALVQKTVGASEQVRAALKPLSKKLSAVILFGSVAKGSDHAQSDIDLIIVSKTLTFADVMSALLPAQEYLRRNINPQTFTPAEFAKRRAQPDSFINRVLGGPHEIILGEMK